MKSKGLKRFQLIFTVCMLIICVFSSSFIGSYTVEADGETGDSGGFIIESAKVDGVLDLVGILAGKITIFEGDIYGLTITKRLNNGNVIRITSPGPIPVKQLKASTKGNAIPSFEGLCAPSKLGRLCMENVTMTVTDQAAASISLPNAKVESCYESECGPLPAVESMSEEELKKLLKQLEDNELTLRDILETIQKDTQLLSTLQELLNQVTNLLDTLNVNQSNGLKELISRVTSTLGKVNEEDVNKEQLQEESSVIWDQQESYMGAVSPFLDTMDEASKLSELLEENLTTMEESITNIESMEAKAANDRKIQLAKRYAELIEVAKGMQEGVEASNAEPKAEEDINPAYVRAKLEEYKSIAAPLLEQIQKLEPEKQEIDSEKKEIEKQILSLKDILKSLSGKVQEEENGESPEKPGDFIEDILNPKEKESTKDSNIEEELATESSQDQTTPAETNTRSSEGVTAATPVQESKSEIITEIPKEENVEEVKEEARPIRDFLDKLNPFKRIFP